MDSNSVKLIRETVVDYLNQLWVSCPNMKRAVGINKELNEARVCSPSRLVQIAQKYGIMSMNATL